MSRLPTPGGDDGNWGNVLNDFLSVAHKTDGTLVDGSVTGTTIAAGVVASTHLNTALQNQINAASSGTVTLSGDVTGPSTATVVGKVNGTTVSGTPSAGKVLSATSSSAATWQSPAVISVAGQTGVVTLASTNLTDVSVSSPSNGQVLAYNSTSGRWQNSTLSGGSGSQQQVDWNATTGVTSILNKPTLATVATSGSYADLTNKPTLSTVAASGSYADLTNKPTIPTTLDSLTDVTATGAANGQVLAYDSTSGQWVANTITSSTVSDATTSAKGIVQLSGDLAGTAASPVVNAVHGVVVSGTPSNGQVLTATGSAAASWQAATGGGSDTRNFVTKTSNYTANNLDFIFINLSSNISIVAPAPVANGKFSIKKLDASAHNVTVTTPSGNFDGYMVSWSFADTQQGVSQDFLSDGTNWYLV